MDVWRLIDECAAIIGVWPGPFTLRALVRMAETRQRLEWDRTACVMALIANCNRDPKRTRPFKPSDFHPYETAEHKPRGIKMTPWNLPMMAKLITGKDAPAPGK